MAGKCAWCNATFPPVPAGGGASGYATVGKDVKICYGCSSTLEAKRMTDTGKAVLYLTDHDTEVTDWPGTLRFKTFDISRSKGRGFGGWKYPIVTGKFLGPDKKTWSFRQSGGSNTIARCKRLKKQ